MKIDWFSKKPKKDKQMDYHDIDNLNDLFEHLIHREHWKEINPDIIKQIFKNSQSKTFSRPNEGMETLKLFIWISEEYNVQNRYIRIAKDATLNLGDILGSFSSTLYFLGSKFGKTCHFAKTVDELEGVGISAEAAFRSSILCNPFNLSSYYGMAVLHGGTFKHKDVGLELCAKYKQVEDMLLNTPDNELTNFQLDTKNLLKLSPKEQQNQLNQLEELKKRYPHLLPDGAPPDGMSLRDYINEIEKELLQL